MLIHERQRIYSRSLSESSVYTYDDDLNSFFEQPFLEDQESLKTQFQKLREEKVNMELQMQNLKERLNKELDRSLNIEQELIEKSREIKYYEVLLFCKFHLLLNYPLKGSKAELD